MNKALIAVVVIVLVLGTGWFLMQGQNTQPAEQPTKVTETQTGVPSVTETVLVGEEDVLVTIQSFAFDPATLAVKKGTTVKWTNQDSVSHTVTSDTIGQLDDRGGELNSELFGKGESFSHTFNTLGTFEYHCEPHPNMKAKVVVEE